MRDQASFRSTSLGAGHRSGVCGQAWHGIVVLNEKVSPMFDILGLVAIFVGVILLDLAALPLRCGHSKRATEARPASARSVATP